MIADRIAEGFHAGFFVLMVAAIPETCGQAMEVPESTLNCEGSFPAGASVLSFPIHAARMPTPGAAISGCNTLTLDISSICLILYRHQRFIKVT